jgi:hypothetical protein
MDLFDFGKHFSSEVPIKALINPLLKFAACACAAKQLGRIDGIKHAEPCVHPIQAKIRPRFGKGSIDWYYCGTHLL